MHPWHLHGYDFHVIGYGTGGYYKDMHTPGNVYVGDRSVGQLSNPLKVDTVLSFNTDFGCSRLTPDNCRASPTMKTYVDGWGNVTYPEPCGWTEIQFKATNLGTWIFHCHIEWHISMSMSIVFDVDSEKLWKEASDKDNAEDGVKKIGYCGFINPDTKPEQASSSYEENGMTSTKQMIVMIATGSFISLFIIACVYWYVRSSSSVSTSNKVLNYNQYTPIYDRA
jgi:hypothetical protein